jgi:CRP-like cAMP-binding protein
MIAIMSALLGQLAAFPGDLVRIDPNQPLFRRGEAVRHLFTVVEGLVHLVRFQDDGAPTVVQRAQPGELVAEASLFAHSYHCDAVAMTESLVRRLSVGEVRERLEKDASFARGCAEHLAHEVHRMRVRSEIMGMKRVSARLDAWMSLRPLPPKGQGGALADDLGVTREALYRELGRRRKRSAARG